MVEQEVVGLKFENEVVLRRFINNYEKFILPFSVLTEQFESMLVDARNKFSQIISILDQKKIDLDTNRK